MPAVSSGPQRPSDPHCRRGESWRKRQQIGDSAGMTLSLDELPNDIANLKALLLAAHADNARLAARNERLDHIIKVPAKLRVIRDGPGCLNRFSASISGASAGVRLPSVGAAG
jgi:hypothetical protein